MRARKAVLLCMHPDKHLKASIQAPMKSMPHVVAHSDYPSRVSCVRRIFGKLKNTWRSALQSQRKNAETIIAPEPRWCSLSAHVWDKCLMLDELPRNLTNNEGVRPPGFALLSLLDLVAELCTLHKALAKDCSIELKWNMPSVSAVVVGNRGLLLQALSHVLHSFITDLPAASKIMAVLAMSPEGPQLAIFAYCNLNTKTDLPQSALQHDKPMRHVSTSSFDPGFIASVARAHDFGFSIGVSAQSRSVFLECWPHS